MCIKITHSRYKLQHCCMQCFFSASTNHPQKIERCIAYYRACMFEQIIKYTKCPLSVGPRPISTLHKIQQSHFTHSIDDISRTFPRFVIIIIIIIHLVFSISDHHADLFLFWPSVLIMVLSFTNSFNSNKKNHLLLKHG